MKKQCETIDITTRRRDGEVRGGNNEPANEPAEFRPVRFKAQKNDDGKVRLVLDFEEFRDGFDKFLESLGCSVGLQDRPFGLSLINQIVAAIDKETDGSPDKRNGAFASLLDIKPNNSLEGMLAAQMIATHHQAMESLREAGRNKSPEMAAIYQNSAIKLMRLFTVQMETLERYRRKGKTTIEIERRGV